MYRLKELREQRGVSQRELAKLLNTSQQQYSKIERGKTDLDGRKLAALSKYFRVSADYILGLTKDQSQE